jgi:hypothetical protein
MHPPTHYILPIPTQAYIQMKKPVSTPTNPKPIVHSPPTGLAGAAACFDGLGAACPSPSPVEVAPGLLVLLASCALYTWPSVGSPLEASTAQMSEVEAGQGGGVRVGLYADSLTPVGVSVFHLLLRLGKSGEMGVGVPERG